MSTTIPLRTPPHLFENPTTLVIENKPDRTSQTERSCKTCGQSWREWRVRGGVSFTGEIPECVSVVELGGNK